MKMKPRRAWLAAVIVVACRGDGGPLSSSEARELNAAESLWRARAPSHYTIEMRRLCFCGGDVTEWATVEVSNETVVAQTLLSGAAVPPSLWNSRPAVSRLFTEIRETHGSWLKDIQVAYDPATGYPTRVSYIEQNYIADAGSVFEARNLVARFE